MHCNICGCNCSKWGTGTIRIKYRAEYYRCDGCGFVFVVEPHWLHEAYREPINQTDVGLVSRNLQSVAVVGTIIRTFFDKRGQFLDYGGGYGLFVRLMRDAGFDFCVYDKYCHNLFAQGFDKHALDSQQYELLTAFEVLEHLVDPANEVEEMYSLSKNLLVTTVLIPQCPPPLGSWWYYAPDHGQHISFFTHRSLSALAERFSLRLCSNGTSLHLLSDRNIPNWLFRLVSSFTISRIAPWRIGMQSLTASDYNRIVEAIRGRNSS